MKLLFALYTELLLEFAAVGPSGRKCESGNNSMSRYKTVHKMIKIAPLYFIHIFQNMYYKF